MKKAIIKMTALVAITASMLIGLAGCGEKVSDEKKMALKVYDILTHKHECPEREDCYFGNMFTKEAKAVYDEMVADCIRHRVLMQNRLRHPDYRDDEQELMTKPLVKGVDYNPEVELQCWQEPFAGEVDVAVWWHLIQEVVEDEESNKRGFIYEPKPELRGQRGYVFHNRILLMKENGEWRIANIAIFGKAPKRMGLDVEKYNKYHRALPR